MNTRALEGPSANLQYYGERANNHGFAYGVTHRKRPIFHTITGGGLEHLLLGAIPRETTILSTLQRNFTCVRNVFLTMGGVCRYHLVIQVDHPKPGEAKNVLMAAFGAHYDIKQAIVVDTDVDIHDPHKIEWAVATRFQADWISSPSTMHRIKLDLPKRHQFKLAMMLLPTSAPESKFTTIRAGRGKINLG